MKRSINKKKFLILNKKFYIIIIFFFLFLFIIFFIFYNVKEIKSFFLTNVKIYSQKYGYELNSFKVKGIEVIEISEIDYLIKPYYDKSIFLIPLDEVSKKIMENNWIESVNLSVDFFNTLYIDIKEYKPVGIYIFNNKEYYFIESGKIIDNYNKNLNLNNYYIRFSGKNSNKKAILLIKIIEKIDKGFIKNISQANFIGNRRWDLILNNQINIKLSENQIEKSLQNFFKLRKKLSIDELNKIKIIDLRDINKAIIEFKDD